MIIEFDKPSLSICPSIFTNNIINKLKYNFAMGQLELKFLIQGVAVILRKLLQTLKMEILLVVHLKMTYYNYLKTE